MEICYAHLPVRGEPACWGPFLKYSEYNTPSDHTHTGTIFHTMLTYSFLTHIHAVCHAEMNAILNKNASTVKGCTIYVGLFPCNECAKLIIQSGLKAVVFVSDKYHDKPDMRASRKLLDMAKVKCRYVYP